MDIYDLEDVLDIIYEYNIAPTIEQIKHILGFNYIKLRNILNILIKNKIIKINNQEEIICLVSYDRALDIINSL